MALPRDCRLNYLQESMWEPGYLKAKCQELGLESEFNAYQIRLWRSYLYVFFVLHICVTLIHCTLLLTLSEYRHLIYSDVGIYLVSCLIILLILSINFCENLINSHPWLLYVSSSLACVTLAMTDLCQGIYQHFAHDWQVTALYDVYIVFMIYMFLPIPSIRGAALLSVIVSIAYIIYFVTILSTGINEVSADFSDISGLSVDVIHYLCSNMFGVFFRVVNEMFVRSSFLDRHQYIREVLCLRNAQRQEKVLLNNILPPQFAGLLQKDIKNRIIMSKQFADTPIQNFSAFKRTMAIQIHPDVSILYADVVNYTHLTTTLTVEKLVTTLHDLYGRFDMAAHHYKVQRIKFLGDCYYCVAGLADPDPDDAHNTVSLGIAMIAHIQKVRDTQDLDINMRIGIHTGSLFAGVIGEAKLQYDVWGPDVQIANALESTGVPGYVHISGTTLNNLTGSRYEIEDGPESAKKDPLLQKYKIETYLVSRSKEDIKKVSIHGPDMTISLMTLRRGNGLEQDTLSSIFMNELHEEYRKMPVSLFYPKAMCSSRGKESSDIPLNNQIDICLTFYDRGLERAYWKQTDYIFKYHMLLGWLVGNFLVYIQLIHSDFVISIYVTDFTVSMSLTALLFVAWYKRICWMRYEQRNIPHSYGRASCAIFRINEKIQESLIIRIFTYLFVVTVNWVVIGLIVMTCHRNEFILRYIEEKIFHYEDNEQICFHPWVATYMLALMICMAFTFTHVPFLLKTCVALIQTIIYCIFIFIQFDFVFHHSSTTNPFYPSEYAHGLIILITFFTMYLKERQSEFAKKVNFNWRFELEKKENDAAITNRSIIILLNNILPNHVVDIYLNSLAKHELYYENYKMVSVMFAKLSNFQMDLYSLRILNEVITQFDLLLLYYKEYYVVEKIKIVNCTYMAACGLDVNFATLSTNRPLPEGRLQQANHEGRDEVVFVMATFALDLMRTLASCNRTYNSIVEERGIIDGTIAIGISTGEIMAGIVGASKPHYDIWGDPVNMASRMEMTGLPGNIQVTEESAMILKDFGIQCDYRGETFVKGRGKIPTYLLAFDEDYNFYYTERKRTPSHVERSIDISLVNTYAYPEGDPSADI